MLTVPAPVDDPLAEDAGDDVRMVEMRRFPPKLLRRLRNRALAGNARYDLPTDFAEQVRTRVQAHGARLDVEVDEPRHFLGYMYGSEVQLNKCIAALIDYMDSLSPNGKSVTRTA